MNRMPTAKMQRAVELGAIELVALLEWELRSRPVALRHLRDRYRDFCAGLLRQLERCGK
jgi:hypothetical protein